MHILIEELKKLTTFFIILFVLFIVNIIFNYNYRWDGISIIVRVYIFLFSFYTIFNFAALDLESLKKKEIEEKGRRRGLLSLFFRLRVIPFALIYLITVAYGLVDHLGSAGWPGYPLISLLSGGYANTIIYSLILLVILKMRRDPQVTIPVFLATSVFYLFVLDKLVYIYFSAGMAVSIIKIAKYFIFFYFLFYEFFDEGKLKALYTLPAFLFAVSIHALTTGLLSLFLFAGSASYSGFYFAADRIMRSGFSFPLEMMEKRIMKDYSPGRLVTLVSYSRFYSYDIDYSKDEWKIILKGVPLASWEKVMPYLIEKSVDLDFDFFMRKIIAEMRRGESGVYENVTRYAARYLNNRYRGDFYRRIEKGRRHHRVWAMEVAGVAGDIESIPWLVEKLSSIDAELSVNAYSALKAITGIDPAQSEEHHANNPAVIIRFRKFYRDSGKAPR